MRCTAPALALAMTFFGFCAHAGPSYVVSGASPFLRTGPGPGYDAVRRLTPGRHVSVGERQGKWVHIHTPRGDSGWVRLSQLHR